MGFQGNTFTWNNGRLGEEFVQERLDRACATFEWRAMFPCSKVTHLQSTYSDHISILINLSKPNQNCRKRKIPRRFEEKWVCQPGYEEVLHASWESKIEGGSPMYRLFDKIKKCRQALVSWSSTIFENFQTQIQEKQVALKELSLQNDLDNHQLIRTLKNDTNALLY